MPLRIIDTAGIREATDAVERIGVEKARDYASRAALVLALFDGSQPLTDEDREILSLIEGRQAIVLLNKADLGTVTTAATIRDAFSSLSTVPILSISTKDERGFDELTAAITRIAGITETPEESYVSGERDAALLRAADDHLRAALETIGRGLSADFISIDLRSAWEKLGEITGETVGEDIIDEIFSRFCIGK